MRVAYSPFLQAVTLFLLSKQPARAWTSSRHRAAASKPSRSRRDVPPSLLIARARNLLSVEECLDLYHNSAAPEEEEGSPATSAVRFVDGSWYHKKGDNNNRSGRADFGRGPRIPGSVYFDVDDIATSKEVFPDRNPTGLSHMQPTEALFAAFMDAFGIASSDHVVIYGRSGCAFLPRIWFTFRHVMGHARVSLMQGSLEDWMAAGGPVDSEALTVPIPRAKDLDLGQKHQYRANASRNIRDGLIVNLEEMKAIVSKSGVGGGDNTLILDTRGSSFAHGHMPGAIHVPYSSLHEPGNPNRFKPVAGLRGVLQSAGVLIDGDNNDESSVANKRIVLSCGSGVSVCSLYLALEECGLATKTTAVYDGSWEEWGSLDDVPKFIPEKAAKVQ